MRTYSWSSRDPQGPKDPQGPRDPQSPGKQIPPKLLDFIREGEKFFVAGHKEPDGDCVGSQLALGSVLRRMGKEVVLCSAGPFKRTEIKKYEHFFVSAPAGKEGAKLIIVDCSAPERTGGLEPYLAGLPCAVIDHHEAGTLPLNPARELYYIDVNAPSATSMVFRLIEELGMEPVREEAELLFFGLCTDTGFFRHVDSEGAETFELAAALIRFGANPKAAFAAINGGKSLGSRKLLGNILARTESFFGGKLLLSYEEYEDFRRLGPESRDSDSLYQLLQAIAGVEAIVIIRQETPDNCSVGLRSRDWVDVGNIAALFGGGGHKNAAGFYVAETIAELRPKLIKAFENVFM